MAAERRWRVTLSHKGFDLNTGEAEVCRNTEYVTAESDTEAVLASLIRTTAERESRDTTIGHINVEEVK